MRNILFYIFLINCFFVSTFVFAFETTAPKAILLDYNTDTVLFEKDADTATIPSSMSKLMTVYVVFEKIKKGEIKLTDRYVVSENAWKKQGSKMFLHVGSSVTVEELLRGIIIQSGNDACITIAEGIAGTEQEFAHLMNHKAKELGLANSNFVNTTGWPDDGHVMSMRDLAVLSKRLISDFPDFYDYFSEKEFVYNNIKQQNRNMSLYRFNGADGLKTGHTEAGGYGIALSAVQKNRRLIVVVNGLSSMKERADESEKLLSYGFNNFQNVEVVKKDSVIAKIPVWLGDKEEVECYSKQDLYATVPKIDASKIKISVKHSEKIKAPVVIDSHIADMTIDIPGSSSKVFKLYSKSSVERLGFIKRAIFKLKSKFL